MRAFVVVCYLLLNVREERRNLYIKIKTPNGIFSTVAFFMYTARQKNKNKRKLLSFGGEGKKFSVYIKKIMLRVNER